MQRDIRESALYKEAEALYKELRQPGTGRLSDATELEVSPDGTQAVFAGTLMDKLEGVPPTRICSVHIMSGDMHVLTFGPNVDKSPRFSPDGRWVAFLSDRHAVGSFQLFILDPVSGVARAAPPVGGWIEYLQWSPDGRRILLGVAGHGADLSSGQGAVTSRGVAGSVPAWLPSVETGSEAHRWRGVWIYNVEQDSVRRVVTHGRNIWEAVWCGNGRFAAVISPGPGEGLWYSARLHIVDAESGESREVYAPRDQIGCPAGCPSGRHLAIVDAVCSDRWVVAGDLRLIDTASGLNRQVDTEGMDVAHVEWRSDGKLLLAGHRGLDTIVGLCDAETGIFTGIWSSWSVSTGGFCAKVSGFNEIGDCALVGEGFLRAPEIALIRGGEYQIVKSLDPNYAERAAHIDVERESWQAPDGLEIDGWLLRPKVKGPYPLVMGVHGGPVSHWRPTWLGRSKVVAPVLLLVKRGYAVFLPNPRGSSGRGQDFARRVLGDMGGADTHDYLSGLDHLVSQGIADPKRIGVIGSSYGGFMTLWLITQDSRFAAAVARAPVSNQVSQRLVSNIPHFVDLFLADRYNNANGKYFHRSPVMYADKVRTPTLTICGALDRCTPPEEAVQFHNALLENGVTSVLVTYPEEGHGVRKFPAAIDYAARVVNWFENHMPARSQSH